MRWRGIAVAWACARSAPPWKRRKPLFSAHARCAVAEPVAKPKAVRKKAVKKDAVEGAEKAPAKAKAKKVAAPVE